MIDAIVEKSPKPVVTIVSKGDILDARARKRFPQGTIFISSITGEGMSQVIEALRVHIPEGPMLYPESDVTDQDVYTRVSEIIREKIFQTTYEEVPHNTYVEVEMLEDAGKLVKILAYIHCSTDSQKKILIGNKGDKIKEIGSLARQDLQDLFEKKVFLDLHIKVTRHWQNTETITRKVLGK
jgi:GTPase